MIFFQWVGLIYFVFTILFFIWFFLEILKNKPDLPIGSRVPLNEMQMSLYRPATTEDYESFLEWFYEAHGRHPKIIMIEGKEWFA